MQYLKRLVLIVPDLSSEIEKTKPDDIAEVKPYESQVKDPKTKIQVEEMKSRIGNVKNLINQRSHQD
jgi:hypothetical protein